MNTVFILIQDTISFLNLLTVLIGSKFDAVWIYHLSNFFMISYLVKESNFYLNIEHNFNIEGKYEN